MKYLKINKIILLSVLSFLLTTTTIMLIVFVPNRLHEEVIIEAGKYDSITETLFLKNTHKGIFTTDVSNIDLHELDQHTIKIKVGYFNYTSRLSIVDTIAPIVRLKSIISPIGQKLSPEDFIVDFQDETSVNFEFITAPNINKSGEYTVEIRATDAGNNTTIVSASALISQVKEIVYMEAGELPPEIDEFLLDERTSEEFITDLATMKLPVGSYPVEILMNEKVLTSTLEVIDTTPPTATAKQVVVYMGDALSSNQMVTNIKDASKVTTTFKESKKWTSSEGTFYPVVLLTDTSNNVAEIKTTLIVKRDTTPPVISGAGLKSRTVYVGESYNVSASVYANDNRDGRIAVKTLGSVNFNSPNEYPITFQATDRAGNTATKEILVTVRVKPPFVAKASTSNADLDALVDSIFKSILHGDMNQYEIVKAIDGFGRSIRYQAGPLQTEWTSRAIAAIKTRTGNCFGRMYAMKAMFTRAGIANRERIQYNNEHSWNQVDIGSGWQNVDVGFRSIFLVSDAYLKNRALTLSFIADDNWETEAPESSE